MTPVNSEDLYDLWCAVGKAQSYEHADAIAAYGHWREVRRAEIDLIERELVHRLRKCGSLREVFADIFREGEILQAKHERPCGEPGPPARHCPIGLRAAIGS